ncbi:hypothetical protein QBC43DRAFT_204051, partial [Cladorrhinum sp. PSN259]
FKWEILPDPNGPWINMMGTVEEVIANLENVYPYSNKTLETYRETQIPAHANESINKWWTYDSRACQGPWAAADCGLLQGGIDYLRGVPGKPYLANGPGICSRVSCSWDTGIYWCNHHDGPFWLDSFNDIADAANDILFYCVYPIQVCNGCWGQQFYCEREELGLLICMVWLKTDSTS